MQHIVVDEELGQIIRAKREELMATGHTNNSWSNSVRTLVKMPHIDCSCDNSERRRGKRIYGRQKMVVKEPNV